MSGTTIPSGYTSVSSIGNQTNTPASTATTASGGLDQNAFLQLLVAQLKYQDPSQPVDSSQFMQQTAMFTEVQSVQAMTKSMDSVLALQQGATASSLVGKKVEYTLADGTKGSGTVVSASFRGGTTTEPTVKVGDTDVALSSITSVGQAG